MLGFYKNAREGVWKRWESACLWWCSFKSKDGRCGQYFFALPYAANGQSSNTWVSGIIKGCGFKPRTKINHSAEVIKIEVSFRLIVWEAALSSLMRSALGWFRNAQWNWLPELYHKSSRDFCWHQIFQIGKRPYLWLAEFLDLLPNSIFLRTISTFARSQNRE